MDKNLAESKEDSLQDDAGNSYDDSAMGDSAEEDVARTTYEKETGNYYDEVADSTHAAEESQIEQASVAADEDSKEAKAMNQTPDETTKDTDNIDDSDLKSATQTVKDNEKLVHFKQPSIKDNDGSLEGTIPPMTRLTRARTAPTRYESKKIGSNNPGSDVADRRVTNLLERLTAVDRTDPELAFQTIDAILAEERRRTTGDTSVAASSERLSDPTQSRVIRRLPGDEVAAAATVNGQPDSSKTIDQKHNQEKGPEKKDPKNDTADELTNGTEEVRQSPDIPNAVNDGNDLASRPGAYPAPGRGAGQYPAWGRSRGVRRSNNPPTSNNISRGDSLFRRSLEAIQRHLTPLRQYSEVAIQAVLVDDSNNEEAIRNRVRKSVREEVITELIVESVDAVPIDPEEAKAKSRRLNFCVILIVLLMATVIGLSVGLLHTSTQCATSLNVK